jgi:hypothetical protein
MIFALPSWQGPKVLVASGLSAGKKISLEAIFKHSEYNPKRYVENAKSLEIC